MELKRETGYTLAARLYWGSGPIPVSEGVGYMSFASDLQRRLGQLELARLLRALLRLRLQLLHARALRLALEIRAQPDHIDNSIALP